MIYKKTWKYILVLNDTVECIYKLLYRVKALKDFSDISKGDLGGYIRCYNNLSQKGNCWVYGGKVCGHARISENAKIKCIAFIAGAATVTENAEVTDEVLVWGDSTVSGNAKVGGRSEISGNVHIHGNTKISGKTRIIENAIVKGDSYISGEVDVSDNVIIFGKTCISGYIMISGNTKISGTINKDIHIHNNWECFKSLYHFKDFINYPIRLLQLWFKLI